MSRRVAILQSNYIPWRGYFDIIGSVDTFVVYDVVQFTKDDWRNRNRIKTAAGAIWLTVPVLTSGRFGQTIAETPVADKRWAMRHWRSIAQAYARAPFFPEYRDRLLEAYERCAGFELLSEINRTLIGTIAGALGLDTIFAAPPDAASLAADRNERLIDICRAHEAAVYLSGPAGRAYLDEARFQAAGIRVEYIDYSRYQPYPQLHGAFDGQLSAVDLLFNTGPDARSYLTYGRRS